MSIEKRLLSDGTVAHLARIRTPDGSRSSRQFSLKKDAQAWHDEQRAARRRGGWVDPRNGRTTASKW